MLGLCNAESQPSRLDIFGMSDHGGNEAFNPPMRRLGNLGSFSKGTPNLKHLLAWFGFVSRGCPQNKGLIGFVWVRFFS